MIFDTLKNCEFYYGLNKNFEKAFDFIKKAEKENLPVGRYDLDENVYGIVQEYNSKNPLEHKFEGHTKYIDIQYISSGVEVCEVMNIEKAIGGEGYIEEREVEFYSGGKDTSEYVLGAQEYGIFWPSDIHKPGLMYDGKSTPVRKVLVKVKI